MESRGKCRGEAEERQAMQRQVEVRRRRIIKKHGGRDVVEERQARRSQVEGDAEGCLISGAGCCDGLLSCLQR